MDSTSTMFDLPNVVPLVWRPTPMEHIALKLSEKTVETKMELADNVASAFDDAIAIYANPDPTSVAIKAVPTAIRAKMVEISDAELAVTNLKAELVVLETTLDATLTSAAAYAQATSKGELAKLQLLPFELKDRNSTTNPPGQVTNFRLSPGKNSGDVKCACKPPVGAKGYEYYTTLDPNKPDSWVCIGSSSGCRKTFSGLTSGTHIWFRVRAVGGKNTGYGAWSDPSVVTVP